MQRSIQLHLLTIIFYHYDVSCKLCSVNAGRNPTVHKQQCGSYTMRCVVFALFKPLITLMNAQSGVQWCKNQKHWSTEVWEDVIRYESSFAIFSSSSVNENGLKKPKQSRWLNRGHFVAMVCVNFVSIMLLTKCVCGLFQDDSISIQRALKVSLNRCSSSLGITERM